MKYFAMKIRAVIDSFETYTINSLMKKKIFETNSIMSRALFWVAQPKRKKIKWFFSRLRWNGNIPCAQILFQFFSNLFQNFFLLNFFSKFYLFIFFKHFFSIVTRIFRTALLHPWFTQSSWPHENTSITVNLCRL